MPQQDQSPSQNHIREQPKIVVVLGKESVNKIEVDSLVFIGRALAARGLTLYTTKTKGAPMLIAQGYRQQSGSEPIWLTKSNWPKSPAEVILFTDSRYQAQLTERNPKWKENDWLVFHNRRATQGAAALCRQLLEEQGLVLDGGEVD